MFDDDGTGNTGIEIIRLNKKFTNKALRERTSTLKEGESKERKR